MDLEKGFLTATSSRQRYPGLVLTHPIRREINLWVCQGVLERRQVRESWKRAGKNLERRTLR